MGVEYHSKQYIKNRYGEKVYLWYIYKDLWTEKYTINVLNCYGSSDLGLGTCQCATHDAYDEIAEYPPETPITKIIDEAKRFLGD